MIAVLTTIQKPTLAVNKFVTKLNDLDAKLIVIGDQKGPFKYPIDNIEFVSLEEQLKSGFEIAHKLPTENYARKNIGYLMAIAQGASCIYETDDDNSPLANWSIRRDTVVAKAIEGNKWVNVYRFFTREKIWPRGFPLDEIMDSFTHIPVVTEDLTTLKSPIQQGLSDNSPDVDAIWRLIMGQPLFFEKNVSVYLSFGSWCPFNSQSTWWWPIAYPLLYLPSYCTFRMTDIWRSFIAQRCLWEMDFSVVFHAAEVFQERNEHNLIRDFKDEFPGYTRNKKFVKVLEGLSLEKGLNSVCQNLLKCYEELVAKEFFPAKELELVKIWLKTIEKICFS